jgi:predicted Zn-dependent protease
MRSTTSNNVGLRGLFDRAVKLHHAGKTTDAVVILEELARRYRKSAPVAGYLAGLYYEQGRFERAARWFKRATTLAPKSELASLGLFHSLWKLRDGEKAISEMRRFLRIVDSSEYKTLLRDLTVEGRMIPQFAGAA